MKPAMERVGIGPGLLARRALCEIHAKDRGADRKATAQAEARERVHVCSSRRSG